MKYVSYVTFKIHAFLIFRNLGNYGISNLRLSYLKLMLGCMVVSQWHVCYIKVFLNCDTEACIFNYSKL